MVNGAATAIIQPDIGTAWLVLSHSGFLGAAITASAISAALFLLPEPKNLKTRRKKNALAILWTVVSLIISVWTLYAIHRTWEASHAYAFNVRIFTDTSFMFLTMVTFAIGVANLLTLLLLLF